MCARTPIPAAIAAIAPTGLLTPRQRRHFVIARLLLRHSTGTGSRHAALRRRTAVQSWPDLRALLADIPWAVVGGVATRAYMPERMTRDMVVLVRQADGPVALRRLVDGGFEPLGPLAISGQSMRSPGGVEVDVLFGDEPWLDEALADLDRDAAGLPVIGLPFLVLLKMRAARTQDCADVARMLGQADASSLGDVRAVVGRFSPDDAEDLEALIFLGRQEMRESVGDLAAPGASPPPKG